MDRPAPGAPSEDGAATAATRPRRAGSGRASTGHERRRELRERPVNGSVLIEGVPYEIFDWSSSGVSARGYDGELGEGGRTRAGVVIALPGQALAFECDLILVRVDRARQLVAGVFAGLSREDRVTVASYFEGVEAGADDGLRAALAKRRPFPARR